MKKLLIILLTLALAIPAAYACVEPGESAIYTGCTRWALTEDGFAAGLKAPDEDAAALPVQSVKTCYIRGAVETGLIRAWQESAVTVRVLCVGGVGVGLTAVDNVAVEIDGRYMEIVKEIVDRLTAQEMSADSILRCTLWMRERTETSWDVAHIFYPSWVDKVEVGTVTINGGRDTVTLYAGDWDGDGELELGFALGWTAREPEKQPEKEPEKQPEENRQTGEQVTSKTCWKFELDFHLLIQRCKKVFGN